VEGRQMTRLSPGCTCALDGGVVAAFRPGCYDKPLARLWWGSHSATTPNVRGGVRTM
jgi:hypothetical protein